MTKLTLAYIRKAIANDPRFDQTIDLDEPGKALVYVEAGLTWYLLDGDRSFESFYISTDNLDDAPIDTVAYWKERVSNIAPFEG
jgi:hypothetical protein